MQKVIISDTSCLILLEKIGELNLLHQLFGSVVITSAIAQEFTMDLPEWLSVEDPENKQYQRILEASLDRGEASAIAFAIEHPGCLLIIDDYKGRKFAEKLGITITGSLGIIIEARLSGHIPSVKPLLRKIQDTNFRLSDALIKRALDKANESE
jgi:predicted nucleic acid-binding protein